MLTLLYCVAQPAGFELVEERDLGGRFYRRGLNGPDATDGRGCRLAFCHEVRRQHRSSSTQSSFAMHDNCASVAVAGVCERNELLDLLGSRGHPIGHG